MVSVRASFLNLCFQSRLVFNAELSMVLLLVRLLLFINNDLEFKFDKTSQIADKNISAFQLKAIYKDSHQDYASEILYKIFKNNYAYLNSLRKTFHGTETIDDFYRIVFANYYDEKEFSKRPLSKLTRDIFDKYALLHKVK